MQSGFKKWLNYKYLYLMMVPGILFYLIFAYMPMWGIVIAFQDFTPMKGIAGSEWVGLKHFRNLFGSQQFFEIMGNTVLISFYKLLFGFPAPILLALLLNEVRHAAFKRVVQSVSYMPHFISWVIIAGIGYSLFNPYYGLIGVFVTDVLGLRYSDISTNQDYFRTYLVATHIWKTIGWGSIIYLAALSGVNPHLYEAASIDGAGRWKQMIYVTLPAIRNVVGIVFILSIGSLLSGDFEQIYLLAGTDPRLLEVADVFETYVYRSGILSFNFSLPTAVGLFQSFFAMILVVSVNWLAKKLDYEGIW